MLNRWSILARTLTLLVIAGLGILVLDHDQVAAARVPAGATSGAFSSPGSSQGTGLPEVFGRAKTRRNGPASFGSGLQICTPPIQTVVLVNPTTVSDCTQAGLQAALDTGGHIEFACGPGPVTIPVSSPLELSTTRDTVLDGGGLVTLDGQGLTRILHKGWHDPVTVGTVQVTLQNLRFINGKAPSGGSTGDHSGGAIASGHPGTRLHILYSTFQENSTSDLYTTDNQGGAIFSSNSYETVIVGSMFEGNVAGNGGAFGGIATGLFVFNSRFGDNHAVDNSAGGIVRGYGGAFHLDGVTNSYNPNSNKRVHFCGDIFEANTAIRGGGAIGVVVSDNKGTLVTYEKSTFSGNQVYGLNGSYGQGGGIYHIEDDHAGGIGELNLEIKESTFQGNLAGRQGGGAWLYILGQGQVVNSTFQGNSTTAPFNTVGQGGAMVVTLGHIDITNVTFANNHAAYQAGALHGGGSGDPQRVITLRNTIFLDNTLNYGQTIPSETEWQGYHTNRPMTDGGQNIQEPRFKPIYNNEVNNNITPSPIYADPLLGLLGDHGGPTLTMPLGSGSPAIDAGAAGCPPADQRGEPRDGPCDIGAYEYLTPRLVVTPSAWAISASGVATYTLQVVGSDLPTGPFDLNVVNPYPELDVDLSPSAILAGQSATLTVSDNHPAGPLQPGLWYSLAVTAANGNLNLPGEAGLLVGGWQLYSPLIER